jgi:hypothetical protein
MSTLNDFVVLSTVALLLLLLLLLQDDEYFKRMPEPCDDELDMLDLAFDLKET